jgi:hypothetical protein
MATQPDLRSQDREASLPLVSRDWPKEMIKDFTKLGEVAKLPIPNYEERLAIARASALIDPYLTRKPKVAGHKIFAKLDVLPREGVGVEQNRFHVDIYIEAILRAELSEYALAEAEGDF